MSSLTAVSWTDLWEALSGLAAEVPLRKAGLQFSEVTDLVQGQLFIRHPVLAMRMSRVIELRFTALNAVAYLRTGIPPGNATATAEAGDFLIGLRSFDPAQGTFRFVKLPRVKRLPNWRQNLRRRLRELADQLKNGRRTGRQLEACSLVELMQPQSDEQAPIPARSQPAQEPPNALRYAEHRCLIATAHLGSGWDDLQAAGISLPVWVSVVTSLCLVLAVLAAH